MVILIIGASGFLGSMLYCELDRHNSVVGTYFTRKNSRLIGMDIRDKRRVGKILKKIRPDIIVDCGGMTRPDRCELEPNLAYAINVQGEMNLMELSTCKIIYFSTDYVFNGHKGFFSETDKPCPINVYGQTKLKAENVVLQNESNLVVRVSGLYGINPMNNEFLLSLTSGSPIYKANDCFGSNLLLNDIVDNWPQIISWSGRYHLSDGRRLSRFEFSAKAVKILGLKTEVIGRPLDELNQIAPRPKESSIISTRHKLKLRDEEEGLYFLKTKL